MKSFFVSFEKWFARFSALYIFIILSFFIKVDYEIYLPGNLTNIKKEIEVANTSEELNGSISSVYVLTMTRPNLFTFLVAKCLPYSAISYMSEEEVQNNDPELNIAIGSVDSEISFTAAELGAYEALGDKVNFSYYSVTYIYSATNEIESSMDYLDLVGKIVKTYNGCGHDYPSQNEIVAYFETIPIGSNAELTLIDKNDKVENITIKKRDNGSNGVFGITISTTYVISESDSSISVSNVYTGGPSGGAMQSLYIYLKLYDEDLLNGRKIAGTGTIGYNVNKDNSGYTFTKIGAIGCVEQKIYAAYIDGASVFYCPSSNYDDCIEAYNLYKEKGLIKKEIRIVKVDYLADIIKDLKETK